MKWHLIVVILCVYGFFKEFRPLEPFLTPYLRSEVKNFTDVQLYSQVYPVWTYSYLAALIPTFLLTDLLRYNIVLICGALFYASTWLLLIYGTTIGHMQTMQLFYGFATATEIAYYAYSYAAIDPVHYKKTTSYVRCVVECGRFTSYALSQTLISTKAVEYMDLNYFALSGSIFILIVAFCLPCIPWRKSLSRIAEMTENAQTIAHQEKEPLRDVQISNDLEENIDLGKSNDRDQSTEHVKTYPNFVYFYFANLWKTFKRIYSTKFMLKWSIWSALAMCGMLQVTNYIQTLWDLVQTSQSDVWNGIVEAINTFLAAIVVVCLQFINIRWDVWGEGTLAIISVIDCVLLIVMSQMKSLIVIYILYIIFRVLYETMFTIAMYNIAKSLTTESFGLVFGFNTFIALILQTLLTIAVADERGFALEITNQFVVYGAYHGLISVAFFIMGIRTLINFFRQPRIVTMNCSQKIEENQEGDNL